MSRLTPVSRAELIERLKKIGFEGPYPGSDHDYMVRGDNFVRIPNPHKREIGVNLISELLRGRLDTDYELYKVIDREPGTSIYDLAKEMNWSSGKVYGSVRRLVYL